MTEERTTDRRRTLVRLSAVLASRDPRLLHEALVEAARTVEPQEVEEVILQSYLFLGYPAALNAFALWRDISRRPAEDAGEEDWEGWGRRGEEVCRTVYGGQYQGLRENVRNLHADMERWMVVEGYGKVLGREGLDLATRELCIAGLLAVLDTPRQLYSHLRGAVNAGAEEEEVEEALRQSVSLLDDHRARAVWDVWEEVWRRTRRNEPTSAGSPPRAREP